MQGSAVVTLLLAVILNLITTVWNITSESNCRKTGFSIDLLSLLLMKIPGVCPTKEGNPCWLVALPHWGARDLSSVLRPPLH